MPLYWPSRDLSATHFALSGHGEDPTGIAKKPGMCSSYTDRRTRLITSESTDDCSFVASCLARLRELTWAVAEPSTSPDHGGHLLLYTLASLPPKVLCSENRTIWWAVAYSPSPPSRTPAGMPSRWEGVGRLARRERPQQTGVSDGGASPSDPPDMKRPQPTKRIATIWPTMKAD